MDLGPLGRLLGRGEDEEEPWESTYEKIESSPNWSHFGIGSVKPLIPVLTYAGIFNGLYFVILVGVIMMGLGRELRPYLSFGVAAAVILVVAAQLRIKSRWDGTSLHQICVYWGSSDRMVLGHLLVNEDEHREVSFSHIHRSALRFSRHGIQEKQDQVE